MCVRTGGHSANRVADYRRWARGRGQAVQKAPRLRGVDPEAADAIFYFFKPGVIAAVVSRGRSLASEDAIAAAHLGAADDYAEDAFAALDSATLGAFTVPRAPGRCSMAIRSAPAAQTAAARAYRAAILLRELRGGVHTDAVKAAGLSPVTACQFNRDGDLANFKMHGFSEEDLVEYTPAIEEQKAAAEAATTAQMAALFAPLPQTQLEAIVAGTNALVAAP